MRVRSFWSRALHGVILPSMQAHDVLSRVQPRRLARSEYDRIVEQGIFSDERVELIYGIVVAMSPIGAAHADVVDVLTRHFVRALGDRAVVRVQQPFAASVDSEPEPDIALVPPGRYAERHPDQAFLVVEVAQASLDYDRTTKAALYAESGVSEYWVVDVTARRVEVYDAPDAGFYANVRAFAPDDEIALGAFSDVKLSLSELFGA